MEIIPGVYRLKIPIPGNSLGYLNAYLVKSQSGNLLVDTGWNTDEAFESLERQLAEASVSLQDLTYIVITHAHPDHYGLVGRLMPLTPAKLVIHEIERDFLQSRYVQYENLTEAMNRWLQFNGVPEAERLSLSHASLSVLGLVAVAMPDWAVCGGERIELGEIAFDVLWTPGHSPGHICLYEPERKLLISGDHVLPGITPNISLHAQSSGNPLDDYLKALDRVAALPVELVLPAHEAPFNDLAGRAAQIRAHHKARNQEIVHLLEAGPKTAYQIAGAIRWGGGTLVWQEMPPIDRRMAVTETLAHLEYLSGLSELKKDHVDGFFRYSLVSRTGQTVVGD